MTKLFFQFPTGDVELTDENKINASFAMLGVVAIIAIIALVFLFQNVLTTSGFGDASMYVVYGAGQLCEFPDGLIVSNGVIENFLKEKQDYKCRHTVQDDVWCCYPKKLSV